MDDCVYSNSCTYGNVDAGSYCTEGIIMKRPDIWNCSKAEWDDYKKSTEGIAYMKHANFIEKWKDNNYGTKHSHSKKQYPAVK